MSAAGLEQQVDRLQRSPRTEQGLRAFFVDMLAFSGLDQDPGFDTLSIDTNFYPRFIANVPSDAQEQTLRTIVDQLLYKNGDYRDLFATKRHLPDTGAGGDLQRAAAARCRRSAAPCRWVPYHFSDSDPYVGILTQVSFLSLHSHPGRSSPTRRGKALREIFLCQKVPPPPGQRRFQPGAEHQ